MDNFGQNGELFDANLLCMVALQNKIFKPMLQQTKSKQEKLSKRANMWGAKFCEGHKMLSQHWVLIHLWKWMNQKSEIAMKSFIVGSI